MEGLFGFLCLRANPGLPPVLSDLGVPKDAISSLRDLDARIRPVIPAAMCDARCLYQYCCNRTRLWKDKVSLPCYGQCLKLFKL